MATGTIPNPTPTLETPSTEYLTNEKFFGSPVYAKIISLGALTANTPLTREFFTLGSAVVNPGKIVRWTAFATAQANVVVYAPYDDEAQNNRVILTARAYWYKSTYWRCRLTLKSSVDMTDAYGCVWYTKE